VFALCSFCEHPLLLLSAGSSRGGQSTASCADACLLHSASGTHCLYSVSLIKAYQHRGLVALVANIHSPLLWTSSQPTHAHYERCIRPSTRPAASPLLPTNAVSKQSSTPALKPSTQPHPHALAYQQLRRRQVVKARLLHHLPKVRQRPFCRQLCGRCSRRRHHLLLLLCSCFYHC